MSLHAHIPLPPAEDLAKTPPSVLAYMEARFAWYEKRMVEYEERMVQYEARIVQYEATIIRLEARIVDLEAKLNINSSNSNQPPSSDPPFSRDTKKNTPKKRKGRKGVRQQMLEPTKIVECMPRPCSCGCSAVTDPTEYYRHQYIETPEPRLDVTHFVLLKGDCAVCGKTVKAHIPHEFRTGFGPRIHALITELVGMHGNSRESVQQLLMSIYNLPISQGAIQKCLSRASTAVLPHYESIGRAAQSAPVNHIDETSWRRFGHLGRMLHWLWVMASPHIAYFTIHAHRSKEAFLALIGDWRGVLVSDDYGVYKNWDGKARQTCIAHLRREAKKVMESRQAEIAACGQWIYDELGRLCSMSKTLHTFGARDALWMRLARAVAKYEHEKNAAGALARHIKRVMPYLMTFFEHEGVGPTNNHAERSLRFAVTWRKRSCGTTSEQGDRFVERILSLRHSCRLQKMRTYPVLVDAMTHFARGTHPTPLCG